MCTTRLLVGRSNEQPIKIQDIGHVRETNLTARHVTFEECVCHIICYKSASVTMARCTFVYNDYMKLKCAAGIIARKSGYKKWWQ